MAIAPTKPTTGRRWASTALQVLVVVVLLFVSSWLASLFISLPQDGLMGEAAHEALDRHWWVSLFVYVGLCVLVFHLVPFVWRRWCRRDHGEAAR